MRKVTLRDEVNGRDWRFLSATLDEAGALVIEGQDLGPSTAPVSSDGEYEWVTTIARENIPRLLEVLGAPENADVLKVLEASWTGPNSYELEKQIRDSNIPVDRWAWSG
jgi:hypothetical protein